MPRLWAVVMISRHCLALSLSGQISSRTRSTRISAAVPGREPRPLFFSSWSASLIETPEFLDICMTSMGEKACRCSLGWSRWMVSSMQQ